MVDYILIILAVICFTAQFAFTKIYECKIKQTISTVLTMVVLTSIVGTVLYVCIGGFRVRFSCYSFLMSIAMAAVMIPYYVVSIKVLSLGSLAVYSMFMMLGGMLVPFVYGIAFLSEDVTWGKVAGCVLLTACMIWQALGQNETPSTENGGGENVGKHRKIKFFALCIVIFFLNGLTGVIAKAHQMRATAVDEISFTVLSCAVTAVLGGILLVAISLKSDRKEMLGSIKTTLKPMPLLIMVLIGGATYTGNFLHLKAAATVPASVQFPVVSGGVIVFSALTSALIFREKVKKREWLAVIGAFLSTFLFMF